MQYGSDDENQATLAMAELRIPLAEFAADPYRTLERVINERQTAIVERDGIAVARVAPVRAPHSGRQPHARQSLDAMRAAFGGWHDVDTDRLVADVYADRLADDHAPVAL